MQATNVQQFVEELGAGVVESQLANVISQVCAHVVDQRKKGKIILKLEVKPTASGCQVGIVSTVNYTLPTLRGDKSESSVSETLFYVEEDGVHVFPTNQSDMFQSKGERS